MSDFSIKSVRVRKLDVPMRKTFGIAGGVQTMVANALVAIELESGVTGYGEAAPLPAFDGETQEVAVAALERAAPVLLGMDVRQWRNVAAHIGDAAGASPSAVNALESAMFDALTRRLGVALHHFFGGRETSLDTDVTITTGTVEEAALNAIEFAEFATLKIKVGGSSVDHDVARTLAVCKKRPDARIFLDANASLAPDEALALVSELRRHDVVPVLFEQPVAKGDPAALGDLRARLGVPIAVDESVRTAADLLAVHRHEGADIVNVKLMKAGIVAALDVVAMARACGIGLMIGGMVESRLAMGTSACFAAGLGGFSFVDLDTPLFLAKDPFEGGYTQRGARLDLVPITQGHGCVPHDA